MPGPRSRHARLLLCRAPLLLWCGKGHRGRPLQRLCRRRGRIMCLLQRSCHHLYLPSRTASPQSGLHLQTVPRLRSDSQGPLDLRASSRSFKSRELSRLPLRAGRLRPTRLARVGIRVVGVWFQSQSTTTRRQTDHPSRRWGRQATRLPQARRQSAGTGLMFLRSCRDVRLLSLRRHRLRKGPD